MANQPMYLSVREIIQETSDTISIVFDCPTLCYQPGQFLTLALVIGQEKLYRAYSLCTTPYTDTYPAITVKRVLDGKVSNYLNDRLRAGHRLEVLPPAGHFTTPYHADQQRHLVFIGGGSGITPLMAILKGALQQEPHSTISLIYANRDENSIIFAEALAQLQKTYDERLNVAHVLSRPSQYWTSFRGRLDKPLLTRILQDSPHWGRCQTEYFICGPEGLMATAHSILQALGVSETNIHRESFTSSTTSNTPDKGNDQARTVTIIYEGQTYQCVVKPGQTILAAALDNDIDLPFACNSGMCNVCQAKCCSGKIVMSEDEGLSQEELEQNYILTCVSHPLSDDVVIEVS